MHRIAAVTVAAVLALGLGGCGSTEPTTLPVPDATLAASVEPAQPDGTATLPADWPSDLPVPKGLTLVNAIKLDGAEGPTWSATYQGPGDAGQVYDELTSALQNNGFQSDSTFGGGPDGGVSTWTKGNTRVQATVLIENDQVAVNLTALQSGG